MSKVLIYSIPFGSGPAGKALALAHYLKSKHEVVLASYSHSVHLLKISSAELDVFDCGSRGSDELMSIIDDGIGVFISMMDVRVANLVKKARPNTRVILIDSLLSWRLKEYSAVSLSDFDAIDSHVCQYVPGVEPEVLESKLGNNLDKLHIIGPLVRRPAFNGNSNVGRRALVHFGGLVSPILEWHSYKVFVDIVTEHVLSHYLHDCELTFSGAERVMRYLRKRFGKQVNVSFGCLPYLMFQEVIAGSHIVLTTPGIETAYESFVIGTPVVFLPALNSTQLHQLKFFRVAGLPNLVPAQYWARLEAIAGGTGSYGDQTRQLSSFVNTIANDATFHQALGSGLRRFLESKTEAEKLVQQQRRFCPPYLEDGFGLIDRLIDDDAH